MSLETRITALAQALAADIKALRTGLAGKAASGANTDITSITGSAAKLTTARTVALNGDAGGSVSFDGSGNVVIPLTLVSTGVTAGTYGQVVVDAKGRVTGGSIITPIANGGTGASSAAGALANLGAQPALGFTPENAANKGKANGYASLDANGQVPAAQLPSFVDDVLEYSALSAFPAAGESGKIYVALDTNKTYRWSGSAYIYITSGAVDSVNGKTGVVVLGAGDVGLGNVNNTADSAKSVASAAKLTTPRNLAYTGDATGSANFDGSANVSIGLTLAATGVSAGTYIVTTVDAKGRVTAGRGLQAGDLPQHSAALLTSGSLDAARLPASGITAGEYVVATFDAYGRATGGRALQASDLPPLQVSGTWGVVGVDGYGRVTAGRLAVASDITGGVFPAARVPILGAVSQSGGAPTGSIIERGSNANGRYVRFADGTQICWGATSGRTTASVQAGSAGYHSGIGNLTYPAAFVGELPAYLPYTVSPTSYYGGAFYDQAGALNMAPNTYIWSPSNSFAASVSYIAIGRWF